MPENTPVSWDSYPYLRDGIHGNQESITGSGTLYRKHKYIYPHHAKKTNKAQRIKGNWQEQAGSLVPYQCGEAVVNGKGEMPEP